MIFASDFFLFQKLNGLAGSCAILDKIMVFLAVWLPYVLVYGFFVFLFLQNKKKVKIFLQTVAALILSRIVIVESIRLFLHRPRPFMVLEAAKRLVETWPSENFKSFPSGHATFFFALSTAVFLENKKLGSIFLVASFLMILGRVFAGVHWPTDVIGGAVIGILSALIVKLIVQKWSLMRKK
jgi:undecaprenyl-diphosphatase